MQKNALGTVFSVAAFLVLVCTNWGRSSREEARIDKVLGLNSEWLEKTWEAGSPQYRVVDSILKDGVSPSQLDVTNSFAVVEFVLKQLPELSVVYPSERYFYFKFYCGHRLISGNLRFCDVEDSVVHFGYFDEYDEEFLYSGTLDHRLGATIGMDGDKVSLNFNGIERSFRLAQAFKNLPKPTLHVDEQIISPILDESGYYLWLLYNKKARRLYYVVDETVHTEKLYSVKSGGIEFLIGLSSRFVFFNDSNRNRKILVGVSTSNIQSNNYFDGPFDQVPPDLNIKQMLEHVYPYVKDGGGLDIHGNFIDQPHSRVAISPYLAYGTTSEMLRFGFMTVKPETDKNSLPFLDLVYESKMDFHLVMENSNANRKQDSNENE